MQQKKPQGQLYILIQIFPPRIYLKKIIQHVNNLAVLSITWGGGDQKLPEYFINEEFNKSQHVNTTK